MEKYDYKKQMKAWRWLGENSGDNWGLEVQLMVSLQKINMMKEKYQDTHTENERKEKRMKKKYVKKTGALKKGIHNQAIKLTDSRRIINSLKIANTKIRK